MTGERIRIVVGEGQSMRQGLLRFVLEGDGYDVVAEASTAAELARVLGLHHPDVVVLDDGIGATAPQVVRQIAPKTKIVLVWPGAVVPIGGDVRVEPAQVLRQLGPAIAKVTGTVPGTLTTIDRPDWVEKVRKDPATLRELLEKRGGLPTKRPSVTELQRRGQRLHPAGTPAEPEEPEKPVAPVVPLPISATDPTIELPDTGAPVLHLPSEERDRPAAAAVVAAGATSAGAAAAADRRARALNRRIGAIALSGAAVIGAVAISLALGGSRLPTDIILAEGPRTTFTPGPPIDPGFEEPDNDGDPGPDGQQGPDEGATPTDGNPTVGPPSPGEPSTPEEPGTPEPPEQPEPHANPPGSGEPPPNIPPDDGGSGPAPTPTPTALPGKSALHNPHGGPPGQTGDHPVASGQGGNGSQGGSAGGSSGDGHPQGGPPGQTGVHPQGGAPGQGGGHRPQGASNDHGNDHTHKQ